MMIKVLTVFAIIAVTFSIIFAVLACIWYYRYNKLIQEFDEDFNDSLSISNKIKAEILITINETYHDYLTASFCCSIISAVCAMISYIITIS